MKSYWTCLVLMTLCLPVDVGAADAYKRPSWRDVDLDCRDTRADLLVDRCVADLGADGCSVVRAVCLDGYTLERVTSEDPSKELQVDHLFPASIAWKRRAWSRAAFNAFYNDPQNLVLTWWRVNNEKKDKMPDRWCPSTPEASRWAARRMREVAATWGLFFTAEEEAGLRSWEAGRCAPPPAPTEEEDETDGAGQKGATESET